MGFVNLLCVICCYLLSLSFSLSVVVLSRLYRCVYNGTLYPFIYSIFVVQFVCTVWVVIFREDGVMLNIFPIYIRSKKKRTPITCIISLFTPLLSIFHPFRTSLCYSSIHYPFVTSKL